MAQLEMAMMKENAEEAKDSAGFKRKGSYGGIREFAEYLDYTSTVPRTSFR